MSTIIMPFQGWQSDRYPQDEWGWRGIVNPAIFNTYNPLINYKWSTQVVTDGLTYTKNSGTSKVNALSYGGQGVKFNGVDQYVVTSNTFQPMSTISIIYSFTVGSETNQVIVGKTHSSSFYVNASNGYLKGWFNGTDMETSSDISLPIEINKEYFVVDVVSTTSVKRYVSGVLLGETNVNPWGTDTSPIHIGKGSSIDAYADGTIKDLYIFNRALTPTEIAYNYSNPNNFYQDALSDATCVLNMPMCENIDSVKDMVSGTLYPIANPTASCRDDAKNLTYGSQQTNFYKDSFGVRSGLSPYAEFDGVAYMDTQYTPSAVFQIEEVTVTSGVATHRVYSSDNSRYINGVVSTDFIVPLTNILLSDANIESIAIDTTRLFKTHIEPQDPLELYNDAVSKGLLT